MNEKQALSVMYPPGKPRHGKPNGGVIQIWVTRACDKSCFNCTQASNIRGHTPPIGVDQFEAACMSLEGYWGTIGMFGGNPATHPQFNTLCEIMRNILPHEQLGLWCNNPLGKGAEMRRTFNPARSNLNVHLDQKAYDEFKRDWPESQPFGLTDDSRHSPPWVAMKDLDKLPNNRPNTEENRWDLIADCDINKYWSAMIAPFRGKLRAWFCEIAGAQSILHQNEEDYPDTGVDPLVHDNWWKLSMSSFAGQAHYHCHRCGIPLRGYGELAQAPDKSGVEQASKTHSDQYKPKRKNRHVEIVSTINQLSGSLIKMTDYMGNAKIEPINV